MGDATHIIDHVIVEGLLEPLGDGAGRIGKLMAFDLRDADEAAIGGANEHFVCGIQIFGPQRFFFHRDAGCRGNVQQNAAGDAFETSGRERGREYASVARTEDIGSRTLRYFAAFVQKQSLIETALLGSLQSPNVEDPRRNLYTGEGRCGVTALLTESQTNRLAIRGKSRSAEQQVHVGEVFAALPESHLVVDGINSRRAFAHVIALNQFVQIGPHFGGIEWERHTRPAGIFLESFPMPFEGKGLASKNAHCGEKSPTIEEPSLAWRKARLLNGNDEAVVRYIAVNHDFFVRLTQQQANAKLIVP